MGECVDHESWEARADYFERPLTEELVCGMDGVYGASANKKLKKIADTRQINLEIIISEENNKINYKLNKYYESFKIFNREPKPTVIFDANECPVCKDDKITLCTLSCGHKICRECYYIMKTKPALIDIKFRVKCPICKVPAENLLHV